MLEEHSEGILDEDNFADGKLSDSNVKNESKHSTKNRMPMK